MFWEWGPDTCDNVNVTMSPSLSLADVISPPLFPLISSTIRGYILLASWRMVCVACAHKNQSGLSIDLAPVLSTGASLGQGYQDNPTSSSHLLRLSPLSPVSNQQLGSSPHITICSPYFLGWNSKKEFFECYPAKPKITPNFTGKMLNDRLAQGFRP